jgi:Tol biopolymer transport system component
MNADGSNPTLLHAGEDAFPKWSPDGKKIDFFNSDGGNIDIYVMNADGSGLTRLSDDPEYDVAPSLVKP